MNLQLPSARRVGNVLCLIVLTLIALSLAGQGAKYFLGHPRVKGFVPLFYVDCEMNIPTWYSSAALALAACLLALIGLAAAGGKDRFRWHWLGLSAIFFLLSADEIAMLHELPIDPLRARFQTSGLLYYPWVILGAAFAVGVGLCYLRFLLHLSRSTRARFLLAAVIFLGGALGVEMLSGWQADQFGEENLTYALIVTVEEMLEMLGVVVFIHALVQYIHQQLGGARIQIGRHITTGGRVPGEKAPG